MTGGQSASHMKGCAVDPELATHLFAFDVFAPLTRTKRRRGETPPTSPSIRRSGATPPTSPSITRWRDATPPGSPMIRPAQAPKLRKQLSPATMLRLLVRRHAELNFAHPQTPPYDRAVWRVVLNLIAESSGQFDAETLKNKLTIAILNTPAEDRQGFCEAVSRICAQIAALLEEAGSCAEDWATASVDAHHCMDFRLDGY